MPVRCRCACRVSACMQPPPPCTLLARMLLTTCGETLHAAAAWPPVATSPYCRVVRCPQEEFKPVVKKHSGFEYAPERPDAENFMKQKWGWRAAKPGEVAKSRV